MVLCILTVNSCSQEPPSRHRVERGECVCVCVCGEGGGVHTRTVLTGIVR